MKERLLICFLLLSLAVSQPRIPQYMGRGYDLFLGNPLSDFVDPGFEHSVFNFNYSTSQTTEDGKYLVPDGVSVRKVSSCSFNTEVKSYRGTKSYQDELSTKAQISGGVQRGPFEGSFSASTRFRSLEKLTTQNKRTVTHASAECEAYKISIDIFKVTPLLPNFVEGAINSYKSGNWSNFFEQFGTHYAYEVTLGGRATQEIIYEFQSEARLNSIGIDISVAAKAKFASFFADASFDFSKNKEESSYAEKYSSSIKELYIGGVPPKDGNARTWSERVVESPMPIRYKLMDLYQLFPNIKDSGFNAADATEQFKKALYTYCSTLKCKQALLDRPSPPPAIAVETKTRDLDGEQKGTTFDWKESSTTLNVKKILIRTTPNVAVFQMMLSDGVKNVWSRVVGGTGETTEWVVPDGQYITQIEYRSALWIDALTFITNKGTKSPKFGSDGGSYNLVTLPEGYRIIGFFGRADQYRIYSMSFTLSKTIFPVGDGKYFEEAKTNMWGMPSSNDIPFDWKILEGNVNLNRATFYSDPEFYGMRMVLSDGSKTYQSPLIGQVRGNTRVWQLSSGERVSRIDFRSGSRIDSLTFFTSSGASTTRYGGSGGSLRSETIPDGYRIIGFFGSARDYIYQLGFYLATTVTANGQQHTLVRRHHLKLQ